MDFKIYGNIEAPTLLLIPGLGVSYEIFLPLIKLLEERFRIIAVQIDGFTMGVNTRFTSVDDGGKILSRILERDEIIISHAIMDAAPLLPLPRWLVGPLRHYQSYNVWTCYHWTGFWKRVFHSHYFDVLLDECRKVFPFGGRQAVLDGYKDVYTNKLESITGADIQFWYGTKEAFVAKPQVRHLISLCPDARISVFHGMNHGQLLIDRPEEVAVRIMETQS